MSDDYDRWNEALARHLLHEREGEPFFLYVDRSVLADASGLLDENEASADFVKAVRSRCLGSQPFRWSRELARSWRDGGYVGVPPVLAVLGFTVLAAAERTTTHFQYYDDLNRLLGRPVQEKMPAGFDVDVPYTFRTLNIWLERTKRFGDATASTHPQRPYVGWPLSQALLRPADGRELVSLLHRAGLTRGGTLDGAVLLRRVMPHLRRMADSPTRRRLMDAVERFPEMVEERLLREFRSWTDAAPVVSSEMSVGLRMAYDDAYGEWWLVGRRPTDTVVTRIRIGDWQDSLHTRGSLEVLHPDPWSLLGRGRVGMIDERVSVQAPAAGPKWLRLDRDVGGWLEQPNSDDAVEQLRLLPARHTNEIAAWRERGLQELPAVPAGWTLWRLPPGTRLTESAPATTARQPWLDGGLCLDAATRTYLRSRRGAPLVAGIGPDDVLEVNGHALAGRKGGVTLPLLDAGDHELRWGDWRLRLRVVERLQEELHVHPELGWYASGDVLRLETAAEDDSELVGVGAWLTNVGAPRPSTTHVPIRTDTIWVLGHEGEVAKRDVRPLNWLTALGIRGSATDLRRGLRALDFNPAFAVAFQSIRSPGWVVEVGGEPSASARGRGVTQLELQQLIQRLLSVGVHPLEPDVERRWKRAVARLIRAGAW